MEVSQSELAEIFGVTTRSIRRWTKNGMPSHGKGQYRTYQTDECIEWRIERRIEEAGTEKIAEADVPDEDVSKAKREAAKAEMEIIKVRERRGELIPFEDVEDLVLDVAERIRQRMLNLPGLRIREIAAETDLAEIREIRDSAVREILHELEDLFSVAEDEEAA